MPAPGRAFNSRGKGCEIVVRARPPSEAERIRARVASRLRVLDELLNTEMEEYFSSPGSAGKAYSVRPLLRRYVEAATQLLDRLEEQQAEGGLDVVLMDIPVTLVDESDGTEAVYVVVGPAEGDPAKGYISCLSPLGLALLMKRVNERVVIDAPGGQFSYRVAAVGTEPIDI